MVRLPFRFNKDAIHFFTSNLNSITWVAVPSMKYVDSFYDNDIV